MSAPRTGDPRWIGVLCRMYAAALWLYPREHRAIWGEEMRLAFRDRCREAARAGRGPWRVLAADLVPDLAVSVANEHLHSMTGDSPMKRVRLYALLLAFAAVLIFRAPIGAALLKAHDTWKMYQQAREERVLRDHEADLAELVETRGGAHADVIAAQLYWAAGQGYRRLYPQPRFRTGLSDSDRSIADARLDRADAAFARALRANDTWALWLATGVCPARPANCDREAALKRLQARDGDNGAVWMLDMDLAWQAHDPRRMRAALARLAVSSRFDSHYGDAMRGMLAAFALRPMPQPLWIPYETDAKPGIEQSAILLANGLAVSSDAMHGLGYKALLDFCGTRDPTASAERAADCRATGYLLAAGKGTLIEQMFGNQLLLRVVAPGDRARIRQDIRDARWRNRHFHWISPDHSIEAAQRWRAAWLQGGGEAEVEARLLHENGFALHAPAGFDDPGILEPPR